jgi:tRNA 2-thiocytidine biosynthesis protein TtcA
MKDPRKVAYEENKLDKKLCRLTGQAIVDYNHVGYIDEVERACPD